MSEQGTPQTRIKSLLKGELPIRPLLMPVVFALGARLENVTVNDFARNATKIVSALRQIRAALKVDGVCCYFDPLLEVEALSGQDDSAEHIASLGRVPVALDVLRRAKLMLKDEPALMVRITGPLTLAAQLQGAGQLDPGEQLQFCADLNGALVKAYLEAGANVIFIVEDRLPAGQLYEQWASLLAPVINVIRFYEALPVLMLADEQMPSETLALITGRTWECALCPSLSIFQRVPAAAWAKSTSILGLNAPAAIFGETPIVQEPLSKVHQVLSAARPAFLTTTDDISLAVDLKCLASTLQTLRGALAAAS